MSEIEELVDDVEYYQREVCNALEWGMKPDGIKKSLADARAALLAKFAAIEQERIEYKGSVDLWHKCMERAKKMWQEAHLELDYWPDGADNIVWLLERLAEAEADSERLDNWVEEYDGNYFCHYCQNEVSLEKTGIVGEYNKICKHADDCPHILHTARLARKAAG